MVHATNKRAPLLTPERRKTAYDVVAAGLTIAFIYGLVTQEQVDAWLQLALALGAVNSGMAGRFVTPRTSNEES